jgi:hypothetical protein
MASKAELYIHHTDTDAFLTEVLLDGKGIGYLSKGGLPSHFTIGVGAHWLAIHSVVLTRQNLTVRRLFHAEPNRSYACSWSRAKGLTEPFDTAEVAGSLTSRLGAKNLHLKPSVQPTKPVSPPTASYGIEHAEPRAVAAAPLQIKTFAVSVRGQRIESLDSETITIDNSADVTVARRIEKSRQWSRNYSVDAESIHGRTLGFSIGAAIVDLKADAEGRLSKHYTVSVGSVETCTQEATVTVGPRRTVRVVLDWKKTVEYGLVRYWNGESDLVAELPYQIAVDLSFDMATS